MMKKEMIHRIRVAVAVIFAGTCFTACNHDTPEENPDKQAINFTATIANTVDYNAPRTIKDGESLETYFSNGDEIKVDSWIINPNGGSSGDLPDLMWRQPMTYDAENDSWIYSPVKYWPNREVSKLAFFAYYLDGWSSEPEEDWGSSGYPTWRFETAGKYCDVLATPIVFIERTEEGVANLPFQHIKSRFIFKVRYWCDEWQQAKADNPDFDPETDIDEKLRSIKVEELVYWNYPFSGTFTGFAKDGDIYEPQWTFKSYDSENNGDYPGGKGVYISVKKELIASSEYQLCDIQYHYPHDCDTDRPDVDEDKIGFVVYGKKDTDGEGEYTLPFDPITTDGKNNIELYFRDYGLDQLKGGYTYTFYLTITPHSEVQLEIKQDTDSPKWSGDGTNLTVTF